MGVNDLYKDEGWLREQYHERKRSISDIADEFDMSVQGIRYWFDKHDIERRSQKEAQQSNGRYRNEEWLREQYVGERRSMNDIARECDVTSATILKYLRRHGIETRSNYQHLQDGPVALVANGASIGDIPGPYVEARSSLKKNGEREHFRVYVHQLLAIAEGADPNKVFSNGEWHVHHKNGLRYDNRPANLEFTTGEEHLRQHSEDRVRTPTGEWE